MSDEMSNPMILLLDIRSRTFNEKYALRTAHAHSTGHHPLLVAEPCHSVTVRL